VNAIIVADRERERESTSMVQVIERAARDPSIDMDKMERLLAMKERLDAKAAVEAYNTAFAEMQTELPEIDEHGKIKVGEQVRSTYAKWEDINVVIKPILAKHGFGLSFRTSTEAGKADVTAILMHKGGHREETSMKLDADTSGSKNGVQALASSVSYAKRYTASAILNITTRGLDDDGNRAGGGPFITDKQVAELDALVIELGGNKAKLCKYLQIGTFSQIPAAKYASVVEEVKRLAQARAGRQS
jgi:ERF superfamily